MTSRLLLPILILQLSSFVLSHAAPPPELTLLQEQYDKAVLAPHAAAVFDLNTKFISALGNSITAAKQAGKLEEVLAMQEDQKRLTDKLPIPDDDEKTPEGLKKLRTIYRDQLAKLEAQRTANHTALLPAYTAKLKALEANLTKVDRIEEAKEVMTYREGLAAGAPTPQAVATANAPVAPSSPTAPGATQAPKVKGDDRKAAEWVLSVGGVVDLWENADSSRRVSSVADLRPGRLSIRSINLNNNNDTLKPVSDADFQVLAGLERLESIGTNKLAITPAAFDVFATCPALKEIQMQYNSLGDALWSHLAGIKKLRKMVQGFDSLPVQGIGISHLSTTTMEELVLGNDPVVDEALKEIGQFTSLKVLVLETTKITDAGMPALAGLNKLERLNVRGTNVTATGLAALKKAPVKRLGYGVSVEDFVTQLPQVAAMFPKLEELDLPRDVKPTTEHWKTISQVMPQVKTVSIQSHSFDDASCEGMDAMPALDGVECIYGKITDAGVKSLARIKKLRWLKVKDAQLTDASLETFAEMKKLTSLGLPKAGNGITEAGIAKFKKKRPDVKIEP